MTTNSANSNDTIVVSHAGRKFGFSRDNNGVGYWYCLSSGRSMYGFGVGCVVPSRYWGDITLSAKSQGFNIGDTFDIYSPDSDSSEPKTHVVKDAVKSVEKEPKKKKEKVSDPSFIKINL